jgi:subtilisin family serine protease
MPRSRGQFLDKHQKGGFMKRIGLLLLVCIFLSLGAFAQTTTEWIVVANQNTAGVVATLNGLGGVVSASHENTGLVVVSGLSDAAVAQLRADPRVAMVEPDARVALETSGGGDVVEAYHGSPNHPTLAAFYPRQWNLRIIEADLAWQFGLHGSPRIRVAVLDTGIDYLHPDLAGRVDLSSSISLVPSDDALVSTYFPTRHPVTDLHFHGTHVAATISSNGVAASGVTSRTTLIGVKVLDRTGAGSFARVLLGLLWAADHDAKIANLSLGGAFHKAGEGRLVGVINRVFNYAHSKGTLIVVAAGNGAQDLDRDRELYAAHCTTPNVACVSATGPTASASVNGPWENIDAIAPYTNYGLSAIDLAAPGGNSGGLIWEACSTSSLAIPICRTGTYVLGLSGTSMAAPHVSGMAALAFQFLPDSSPSRMKAILETHAENVAGHGKDPYYGYGRLGVCVRDEPGEH